MICQHPDLGRPSLQHCEKHACGLYATQAGSPVTAAEVTKTNATAVLHLPSHVLKHTDPPCLGAPGRHSWLAVRDTSPQKGSKAPRRPMSPRQRGDQHAPHRLVCPESEFSTEWFVELSGDHSPLDPLSDKAKRHLTSGAQQARDSHTLSRALFPLGWWRLCHLSLRAFRRHLVLLWGEVTVYPPSNISFPTECQFSFAFPPGTPYHQGSSRGGSRPWELKGPSHQASPAPPALHTSDRCVFPPRKG